MPPPDHVVRLRDGDREIEVSGNPAFVRQVLDDLPALMARLRGEGQARSAIAMPAPPSRAPALPTAPAGAVAAATTVLPPSGNGTNGTATPPRPAAPATAADSLEDRVLRVLRGSDRPLAIAAIRQRLDGPEVTGQQVRRLLERAGPQVIVSTDRPATYSLR